MIGATELYNLLNVSGVTGLLGSYGSGKALFCDSMLPEDCTATGTINFYQITPYNAALEFKEVSFSASCRAATHYLSNNIASAVVTAVNRKSGNGYFTTCSILQTISPADENDDYNTPVEIIFKSR